MTNRLRVWATLTIIIALACLAESGWAGFRPKVSCATYGNAGSLIINGKNAIRFQTENGKLSPFERAQVTTSRLSTLLEKKLDPATLRVEGDKHTARIYAGDNIICVATSNDAKFYHTTAIALANSWLSSIRSLLLMPPITIDPKEIAIPLGENRQVEVGGAAVGPLYAKINDGEIANVSPEPSGRYVVISAKKLGRAEVEISVEGQHATLVVFVKKYAGSISGASIGHVTGNPCPASIVCYAARQAVTQNAVMEPNAALEIGKVDSSNLSLSQGQKRQVKVSVRISGPNYIPFTAKISAEVQNLPLPCDEAAQLFYSNDPESITKYQSLFAGKLDLHSPIRVLYHHQNAMNKRVHFIVELVNPNDASAKIRVFRGISPPSVNTVIVGHIAGNAFMKDCVNDVSVLEAIPPQSRLVLVSDMLGHKQTASGILQLKQMEGQNVYVRITAAEPLVDNVFRGTIARAPDVIAFRMSDDIYPFPIKTLDAEYIVGSRWSFIPIGKHALEDNTQQKKLYGNYGVTYNINVRISNPTSEKRKVSFVFDPTAGPASGVFIINGKFALAKYAQPPDEVSLATITLKPGETRNCKIVTVPLAGSNYPATLIVRS